MPVYVFKCDGCGKTAERLRPVDERNRDVVCRRCYPKTAAPAGLMRRVFTAPGVIVRPSGWNLRPGDRGYSTFDREAELGELRGASANPVGYVADDAIPETPLPQPSYEALRELHQFGEVVDRAVRERDDIEAG